MTDEPDTFDFLSIKSEGSYSNKGREKIYRNEKANENTHPKK